MHTTTASMYLSEQSDSASQQPCPGDEERMYLPLEGTLPPGHTLVLNTRRGTFSYLSRDGDRAARLQAQTQFTSSELSLLRPLLELFPNYCPYEILFASFYNGTITDETVANCRQVLYQALEDSTWEQQLRPLRNVLSRARSKLRPFRIDISSILETGYVLVFASRRAEE